MSISVAEPGASYQGRDRFKSQKFIEVLVYCPGVQELYTYELPDDLTVEPGYIVIVPFGAQILAGIAIRCVDSPPPGLAPQDIREIEDVTSSGFFPPFYCQLLHRIAQYYCVPLIEVIRAALPPGLLKGYQRRIRLQTDSLPPGWEAFCSSAAQKIVQLLLSQANRDYSAKHLYRQVRGGEKGIKELIKRGWVESYLEPPKPPRPKQQKAVTLIANSLPTKLTPKQREVWEILRRRGGELWLQELLQICHTSSSVVENLESKGCVVIEARERLRTLQELMPERDKEKDLTPEQSLASTAISSLESYTQILLHGVTGSGKTEVYLQAIAPLLTAGKSVLVLVPEIGLTPQLTDRFRARFGNKVWVYHSGLNSGERYDTWRSLINQEASIVIGTRSAIFAPLSNLGLIILDEEHDSSYKQDDVTPTYHARTVAKWRAELADCPLILGSATPSITTWVEVHSTEKENNLYLSLPNRVQSRPLPPVEIVDLRRELQQGNRSIFSSSLQNALERLQQRKEQGILFIPRRGYSTFVSCRSCGYVIECPHCDVSLSYHHTHQQATELLRCHYCNHTQVQPRSCPECNSPYFKHFGTGTQKVAQELSKSFPELRFIRFDSDTTRTKGAHRILLTRFAKGEADLLIGTQMLTKGLDLAQVTLVGVVAADGLLHQEDYCASERAFQNLTQVAGRAGRGSEPGKVIIQTYSPHHPVIEAVKNHDYHSFIADALAQRQDCNYPPYGRLILLKLKGLSPLDVAKTAEAIANSCEQLSTSNYEILGPAPARIMRVARRHHWQILLKFPPEAEVDVSKLIQLRNLCPQGVSLTINVDPLSME
ncbi:MAG: primosomal protein N' [Spirulinaceae cyanobacterium]